MLEPLKRGAFSDIVDVLEEVLSTEEKEEYKELTEQYSSMRELMEDSITQLKRSQENNEKRVSQYTQHPNNAPEASYSKAVVVGNPEYSIQAETEPDEHSGDVTNKKNDITYTCLDFQAQSNFNNNQLHTEEHKQNYNGYVMLPDIERGNGNNESSSLLPASMQTGKDDSNIYTQGTKCMTKGYISIETANG